MRAEKIHIENARKEAYLNSASLFRKHYVDLSLVIDRVYIRVIFMDFYDWMTANQDFSLYQDMCDHACTKVKEWDDVRKSSLIFMRRFR